MFVCLSQSQKISKKQLQHKRQLKNVKTKEQLKVFINVKHLKNINKKQILVTNSKKNYFSIVDSFNNSPKPHIPQTGL